MLESLDSVREYAYLPAGAHPDTGADWGVGVQDVLVLPTVEPLGMAEPEPDPNMNLMYERVPRGEVELRQTSSIYSADRHHLGSVYGVEIAHDGLPERTRA